MQLAANVREGDLHGWCVLEAWGGQLLQRLTRLLQKASLSSPHLALGSLQQLGVRL